MTEQSDRSIEIMMAVHKDIGHLQGTVNALHQRFDDAEKDRKELEKEVEKNTSYRNAVKVVIGAIGLLTTIGGYFIKEILSKIHFIQGK